MQSRSKAVWTKVGKYLGTAGVLLCLSCTSTPPAQEAIPTAQASSAERTVASGAACDTFNALSADEKLSAIFDRHIKSAGQSMAVGAAGELWSGGRTTSAYVEEFLGGWARRVEYDKDAMEATTKFLLPSIDPGLGFRGLEPTLTRKCDFFEKPAGGFHAKMVHALGTLAKGHMILFGKLHELDSMFEASDAEIDNPWTGLFSAEKNNESVPLLIRFSIANPIAQTLQIPNDPLLPKNLRKKSFALEFIPGVGLKFLVTGQKSVDLLAMESLAGQGDDQNFFKYDFTPDFSAHAPPDYNTGTGSDKADIMARYDLNPINRDVMGLVGKRFFQVIPAIYGVKAQDLAPHSNSGPQPFVISIQRMAAVDKNGNNYDVSQQKRPWRIVFRPALDNVGDRRSFVTSSTPHKPGDDSTDFRYKLAQLEPGDRVFYVDALTNPDSQGHAQKRFLLGEIILDSAPFPSLFADREFFIQHELEIGTKNNGSVSNP